MAHWLCRFLWSDEGEKRKAVSPSGDFPSCPLEADVWQRTDLKAIHFPDVTETSRERLEIRTAGCLEGRSNVPDQLRFGPRG